MTKQQFKRAKGEISRARKDSTLSEIEINTSADMLRTAWREQKARLAERKKTTQQEVANFLR